MGEIFLENSQIDDSLKRIAFRRNYSVVTFIFCIIFGFLFLFVSLSSNPESELITSFIFILFCIIILAGTYVLFFFGRISVCLLFYYNMIKPLHLDQIDINSKFIMSKKNQIYIMFSGFANGVYFIKLEKNDDRSLLNKQSKKIPQFIIRLNKKTKIDNISIKYGEFIGFYKIPINKFEYIVGNARVFFMPIVMFSKTQNTTEYIIKMIDLVQEKSF
jgi:hypothetical protein